MKLPTSPLFRLSRGALPVLAFAAGLGIGTAQWVGGGETAADDAVDLSVAFERIADELADSVVLIRSTQRVDLGRRQAPQMPPGWPFGEDSPFGDLFRMPDAPRGPLFRQGVGSGFVYRADGYILTNSHVVADADKVLVVLPDGSEYEGTVVGQDPPTDLAVVKVDAEGLPEVRLGSSDGVRTGEWVAAVGSPFGLVSTVTAGIVSATGRKGLLLGNMTYQDFIQTDAAINPGNSGGPLVDLTGRVIGVNTAIVSRTGGAMGVGFAIPVDLARSVAEDLIEKGTVVRGWLGVLIQPLSEQMAEDFGLDSTAGALVGDVVEGAPAEAAGIRPGDVIVEYRGEPIESNDELRFQVAKTDPGTEVEVVVVRDGERRTLSVTIEQLSSSDAGGAPQPQEDLLSDLGLSVQRLTPNLARRFGYDEAEGGVVVRNVEPLSAADRAGLRPGDIILRVGERRVETPEALNRALAAEDVSDGVRLWLQGPQGRRFAFLKR